MTDEIQGLGRFAEVTAAETISGVAMKLLEQEKYKKDYQETTQRLQKERSEKDFKRYKDTDLEIFTVRLMPGSKEKLKTYFSKRGLSLSAGVRQILQGFIEKQGI